MRFSLKFKSSCTVCTVCLAASNNYVQWNLSIVDILGPDIFGNFLLQYRGFPLSEVKNVLVTHFGTKIFVLIMEVFSIVSLIRRVC